MIIRILRFIFLPAIINLALAQEFIPSWFQQLPEMPDARLAVGYSGKYVNDNQARSDALELARKNMTKQISIRLAFDLEELSDGRLRLLNPSFKEYISGGILQTVTANSVVIDSALTEDGYFILLAYPASEYQLIPDAGDKTWGARPDWIENLPNEKGFVFGVGMVARYRSWIRAWYDADEYARFDLGKNLQIKAESVHATQRDNRTTIESVILKQTYDLTLKDVTIVARWFDIENNAYYSLSRAPRQ